MVCNLEKHGKQWENGFQNFSILQDVLRLCPDCPSILLWKASYPIEKVSLHPTLSFTSLVIHITHQTLHSVNNTISTTHYTLQTNQNTLLIKLTHCTLHTIHCTLHTAHYTLYTTQYRYIAVCHPLYSYTMSGLKRPIRWGGVTCHVSCVTCHVSCISCHMSGEEGIGLLMSWLIRKKKKKWDT